MKWVSNVFMEIDEENSKMRLYFHFLLRILYSIKKNTLSANTLFIDCAGNHIFNILNSAHFFLLFF